MENEKFKVFILGKVYDFVLKKIKKSRYDFFKKTRESITEDNYNNIKMVIEFETNYDNDIEIEFGLVTTERNIYIDYNPIADKYGQYLIKSNILEEQFFNRRCIPYKLRYEINENMKLNKILNEVEQLIETVFLDLEEKKARYKGAGYEESDRFLLAKKLNLYGAITPKNEAQPTFFQNRLIEGVDKNGK